jgi:anti-sigma B factor antagonist
MPRECRSGGSVSVMSQAYGGIAVVVVADSTGATVTVAGDLDLRSTPHFMDRTLPIPDDRSGSELTIDMTAVGFCDSAGIGALVTLRQRCDERGWRLRVVNLQPPLRRMLVEFSGLGEYLNVQ